MQVDLYMKFIPEMPGQCIRSIHAPVLTARTAKAHLQRRKPTPDIVLHRYIHDIIRAIEEFGHPRLLLEIILHRLVATRLRFELRDPPRIEDAPAVEDKTAAIAAFIEAGLCSVNALARRPRCSKWCREQLVSL